MNERNMQTFFGKYLQDNLPKESEAYELKFTKGGAIPFSQIKEHQLDSLKSAEDEGLYHKITDQPWLPDRPYSYTLKKPFDCFALAKAKGYVVVWFYKPREPKRFIKMRIKDFMRMRKYAKRKSFTEEMALGVGEEISITV